MVEYTEGSGDTLDFDGATEYTEISGEVLYFELVLADRVQLPARTLQLSRNAPTATGAGTATVTNPARTLQLSRGPITVKEILAATLPGRTLELSRAVPEATGAGTATAQAPNRTLELSRSVPRAGFARWVLDSDEMGTPTDETTTHDTLALSFRAQTDTLTSTLRPLKSDEGQVDALVTDNGGFTAVDRANGANTFELIPPVVRQPLRQQGDYHVARYEENLVSQTVDEWDVALEFVPDADRADSPSISQTPASDEWGLTTRYGQIATDRVDADFLGTGADGVERFEIVMRLTFDQAHVWEAALSRLDGVRVREIPDGTNQAVDDTDDDANTLAVAPPAGDTVVSSGDYVVLEWESTRLNEGFQEVSAEIAREG